jgi:hypothetical protein
LGQANKIQDAAHGEGFWVDHWTYNLDLLENYASVYPDSMKALLVERRDFTFFDSDHIVQPRHRKYVRRDDGEIRQLHAVIRDAEKAAMIRSRKEDPNKVRTRGGQGSIYQTTLLAKIVGLLALKASTLDPFGVGIEMEAEKPGWCDALNGLPGLIGSSVNESFELRRWIRFLQARLPDVLAPGASISVASEVTELLRSVREALTLAKTDDFFKTWDTLSSLRERYRDKTRLGVSGDETPLSRADIESFLAAAAGVLDETLKKPFQRDGLCVTYYINTPVNYESLPVPSTPKSDEKPEQFVRVTKFKQTPVSPFLEGPVHALRVIQEPEQARKLYRAVKASPLYDRKLKMYRLNVPLTKESFEVGRNKIFTPGWLENESIFLHMAYKFLLETLRSGLPEEFFEDFKHGLVAFQDPLVYGRSTYENSSFICSSRFPDRRVHGTGFVARLTGATAEWISMVLHMGLGADPFRYVNGELRFEPKPVLARWLFTKKAVGDFERDTFGFKLFGRTWIVYHNPHRRDTFSGGGLAPVRFSLRYADGQEAIHEGSFLPEPSARDLRDGKLTRVTIELQ